MIGDYVQVESDHRFANVLLIVLAAHNFSSSSETATTTTMLMVFVNDQLDIE